MPLLSKLIIKVSFMLHPATAHFAVVLPIISLVLGMAYLVKPSELMSKISSRFMLFAALFLIAAYFSGTDDGSDVYPFLSEAGQELLAKGGQGVLITHKALGLYLAIAMGIATLVKYYGCFKKAFKFEIFAILLVAIISGGIVYQAKMGGELTYSHGANVEQYDDGMMCLEEQKAYADF